MIQQPSTRLIGLSFGPLPFESTISVLTRLYWFNAMKPGGQKGGTASQRYAPLAQLPARFAHIDQTQHLILDEWLRQGQPERELYASVQKLGQLAQRIRYCPLCLENCYHSYLFQWLNVDICPMHKCPLTSLCMHCGTPAVMAALRTSIGIPPYKCHRCKQPLGGAMPDLAVHLDLRSASDVLEAAIHPIKADLRSMEPVFRILRAISPALRDQSKCDDLHWCNGKMFLRSVEEVLRSKRLSLGAESARGVTSIIWRFKSSNRPNLCGRPISGCQHRCAGPKFNPAPVYRATRAKLKRWILSVKETGVADTMLMNFDIDSGNIPLKNRNSLCAAYALFTRICENLSLQTPDGEEALNLSEAICHVTDVPMWCAGHRLGYRALLLCLFSVLHAMVTEHGDLTLFELMRRIRLLRAPLPALHACDQGVNWGAVFFPAIPAMPLDQFVKKRSGALRPKHLVL